MSQDNAAAVHTCANEFRKLIDRMGEQSRGKTRELSLARTKIEEAEMWALRHLQAAP